ncbi:MAG TPA: DUF1579 domain-containing protein [Planctomycetota bacterium]|nr:DUF1579 domain-containing protein [Planctomycetota bacterium]
MKFTTLALATLSSTSLLFSCASTHEAKTSAPAGQAMEMPKPGPEHEMIAHSVGTWDATMTDYMSGGTVSKGVSTRKMTGGGFWLVEDYTGQMAGGVFSGHGVTGYDQAKKKYVGMWVDSMSSAMMTTESTYDAGTHKLTAEGMMPMGTEMVPITLVSQDVDDDTQVFTMSMAGEDGKPMVAIKIDYKRRK